MNRIKQLREENNITQIQLAKKLNKTQQAISLYEKGSNEPDIESLKQMASLFHCSLDYLLGLSDIRNNKEIKIESKYKIDLKGLNDEEIQEIQKHIEFIKKIKKEKK